MTPREQMTQAVAKAIWEAQWGDTPWPPYSVSEIWEALEQATAALSAIEAAGAIVVPVEPTDEMVDAAVSADRPPLSQITVRDVLKAEYAAMLANNPYRRGE